MIAIVHGRIREEEKLLHQAASRLGIPIQMVSDNDVVLDLDGTMHVAGRPIRPSAVLVRSISTTRGLYVARAAQAAGIPVYNTPETAAMCADKAATSWALRQAGVPTPETRVAFTPEAALEALDDIGYPAVLKPVQGSWARLIARVRDRQEAEQILEHREHLQNPLQHVYYVQEYVDTTQGARTPLSASGGDRSALENEPVLHRDLRAFSVGGRCVAAIHRTSDHWITNTARGGTASGHPITPELADLVERASAAVGGGILAMDLMEGPDGLFVHEVNHSMEFRNSISTSGVDIPGHILGFIAGECGIEPTPPRIEATW